MHEEKNDEQHFGERDHQRHDRVPCAEIDEGDARRQRRADQKRDENSDVNWYRNDVVRSVCCSDIRNGLQRAYRPPIKYRSGNRKIHTISTKCQYKPLIFERRVIFRRKPVLAPS